MLAIYADLSFPVGRYISWPDSLRKLRSTTLGVGRSQSSPHGVFLHPPSALNSAEFRKLQSLETKKDGKGDDDEDLDLCPVDCVKEFRTNAEFSGYLEAAKQSNSLVVVDFYRTACGSCKYIEQGFMKLCKGAGDHADAVIFLKHNVSFP